MIYTADEGDNARHALDKARAIADDLIRSKITIDGQPGPDVTRFRRVNGGRGPGFQESGLLPS